MNFRRPLSVAACLLVVPAAAVADGTVRLDAGRAAPTALVAMGLDGRGAALYPRLGKVRVVVAAPDVAGVVTGGTPQDAPVARGAVIEGMVIDGAGRVFVLARSRHECSGLLLVVRDTVGVWSTVALGGALSRSAVLAADPTGAPGLVSVGCAGEVALRRPDATGAWPPEAIPATAGPQVRPALALGASGAAVVGLDGEQPQLVSRSVAGAWAPLPLPDRPLFFGERVVTFVLAIDAGGAPMAAMTRAGPLAPGITGSGPLSVARRLDRFSAGAWAPLPTGGVEAVDVSAAGDTWVARRRDRTLLVQSPAGTSVLAVDALAVATAPGGRVAYIPRGAPSVLGFGSPPKITVTAPRGVRFGDRAPLAVRLATTAGAPISGARVRAGEVSGVTDGQGRVALRPVLTRTASFEVVAAEPGPAAPARAPVKIAVRPQAVFLRARFEIAGAGVAVRGSATGGVALAGPLGRVYLVDLSIPGRGFLPGRALASSAGGRAFRFPAPTRSGSRLAIFYKGALLRLR